MQGEWRLPPSLMNAIPLAVAPVLVPAHHDGQSPPAHAAPAGASHVMPSYRRYDQRMHPAKPHHAAFAQPLAAPQYYGPYTPFDARRNGQYGPPPPRYAPQQPHAPPRLAPPPPPPSYEHRMSLQPVREVSSSRDRPHERFMHKYGLTWQKTVDRLLKHQDSKVRAHARKHLRRLLETGGSSSDERSYASEEDDDKSESSRGEELEDDTQNDAARGLTSLGAAETLAGLISSTNDTSSSSSKQLPTNKRTADNDDIQPTAAKRPSISVQNNALALAKKRADDVEQPPAPAPAGPIDALELVTVLMLRSGDDKHGDLPDDRASEPHLDATLDEMAPGYKGHMKLFNDTCARSQSNTTPCS